MIRERDVERAFAGCGERAGALVLKFVSPGTAGVPDRIVLFPGGRTAFVELKAPGRSPRPLQLATARAFELRGHPVYVIDTPEAARHFWEVMGDGRG